MQDTKSYLVTVDFPFHSEDYDVDATSARQAARIMLKEFPEAYRIFAIGNFESYDLKSQECADHIAKVIQCQTDEIRRNKEHMKNGLWQDYCARKIPGC